MCERSAHHCRVVRVACLVHSLQSVAWRQTCCHGLTDEHRAVQSRKVLRATSEHSCVFRFSAAHFSAMMPAVYLRNHAIGQLALPYGIRYQACIVCRTRLAEAVILGGKCGHFMDISYTLYSFRPSRSPPLSFCRFLGPFSLFALSAQTYSSFVCFFAELQMLAESDVFVGSFSSNVSRLLALRRESLGRPRGSTLSVDIPAWHPG